MTTPAFAASSPVVVSARIKTRQHVNPLAATFQAPVVLPERWFQSAFRNPSAPLLVDIGKESLVVLLQQQSMLERTELLGVGVVSRVHHGRAEPHAECNLC